MVEKNQQEDNQEIGFASSTKTSKPRCLDLIEQIQQQRLGH